MPCVVLFYLFDIDGRIMLFSILSYHHIIMSADDFHPLTPNRKLSTILFSARHE